MLCIQAFFAGLWRALLGVKSIVLLYLVNLLFSAVVAVPIYSLASERIAPSPAAGSFLGAFDDELLADFVRGAQPEISALSKAALVSGACFFLVHLFLLGGVLAALTERGKRLTFTGFFASCGRHFPAFLRGLVPAGAALLLFIALNGQVNRLLAWYFESERGRGASAEMLHWTMIGKTFVMLALFLLLVVLPTDLARVRCVLDDDRAMLKNWFRALRFSVSHPLTLLVFFALAASLQIALLAGHDLFLRHLPLEPLHPLGRLGWGWDPVLSPQLATIVVAQIVVFVSQGLLLVRAAGLITIWRERSEAGAPRDPELVYARSPVVDAPAPRRKVPPPAARPPGARAPQGYAMMDDESTGGRP